MEEDRMVSIVVPVYNVQAYLQETLDCLCNQSYSNIEIICVNDGSTDESLDVLNTNAKKDSRIRVYNQPNAGAGAARNYGLKQIKGEYVLFFDSDDLCSPDLIQKTVNKAIDTDADIVAYNYVKFYEDGTEMPFSG
ncbi:MAG: glycosyltransferase family 2 protein, partial [Erysipelotrichaceae bacterium]|nr:glycosyltransferase family 2 protein [Erysipelotrichaceae bacterium]